MVKVTWFVMDIETYNKREKMLKLREELLSVEEGTGFVETVDILSMRWHP